MTTYELEQHLNTLYRDLDTVESMDEETACRVYNADNKADIIEDIEKDIATYRAILGADDCEDDGMDYDALCKVQGLRRYA